MGLLSSIYIERTFQPAFRPPCFAPFHYAGRAVGNATAGATLKPGACFRKCRHPTRRSLRAGVETGLRPAPTPSHAAALDDTNTETAPFGYSPCATRGERGRKRERRSATRKTGRALQNGTRMAQEQREYFGNDVSQAHRRNAQNAF